VAGVLAALKKAEVLLRAAPDDAAVARHACSACWNVCAGSDAGHAARADAFAAAGVPALIVASLRRFGGRAGGDGSGASPSYAAAVSPTFRGGTVRQGAQLFPSLYAMLKALPASACPSTSGPLRLALTVTPPWRRETELPRARPSSRRLTGTSEPACAPADAVSTISAAIAFPRKQ
jgi:hypothetical protein